MRVQNKINFQPYYQRNYVWDADKATYFIESILLGTEIPPLVFFNTREDYVEVIDGRQRYETINRFFNNDFSLTKHGLKTLTGLAKKRFCDLEPWAQNIINDTKLRILVFEIIDNEKITEMQEDLVKKEIFKRYNTGISPITILDINRARFTNDLITNFFKEKLTDNIELRNKLLTLFFSENKASRVSNDAILDKIRGYLVLHKISVTTFSKSNNRAALLHKVYEGYCKEIRSIDTVYNDFQEFISILMKIKNQLNNLKVEQNKLIYECLLWALYICHEERINLAKLDKKFINGLARHLSRGIDIYCENQSHYTTNYKRRYTHTLKYFSRNLNRSSLMKKYIERETSIPKANLNNAEKTTTLEFVKAHRLDKGEPQSITIEDIIREMNKGRFLIRPAYQRQEVITKDKSSSIIESILLGIKLPPIFIFRRREDLNEVVDGQQRLLSILAFISKSYNNETGVFSFSKNNGYRLKGLTVYQELNGKSFSELDPKLREKVYSYSLSIVIIDEDRNPSFNPIDLFIRLNNRPYPIKENSFEMWNSYIDKDVINTIKNLTAKYSKWFYFRNNNTRMVNEEILAFLSYFNYMSCDSKKELLDIYKLQNRMCFRIKNKRVITDALKQASLNVDYKNRWLKAIKGTELLIRKVEFILIDRDIEVVRNEFLKKELDRLFCVNFSSIRRIQDMYALWYILNPLSLNMVKAHRTKIKEDLSEIFLTMKNNPTDTVTSFKERILEFQSSYLPEERNLRLSKGEINTYISSQGNLCPICNESLFIGDTTHNDHIIPLAVGGKDQIENIQVVHAVCNLSKGCKL